MSERAWRAIEAVVSVACVLVAGAMLMFGLFTLAGCAVGFDPEGRPVVGMGIGESDADAIRRAATGIASFLPEPWGTIAVTGISAAFGVLGIGSARSATRNRREADTAYDEATAAKVEAARLSGKERGWEEREHAATVQAPLPVVPGPVAARVDGSVPA